MSALPQAEAKLQPSDTTPSPRLQEAQKMETIGRLVSGVAHDFNNLLTGIVLCSDLLLAGLERDSRLRRYAQEIRAAGAQGAGMIQQLLAVARQRPVVPSLLSLNQVITGMRNLLTRLIGENVELHTELADDLKLVKTDPAQLQQVILNLVLNARDAMPDGGQVTLKTRNLQPVTPVGGDQSPWSIEVEVRDTGCGMDEETRARVFEPFFTTKKSGKGSGLGLATVHSIVENDGGTINLESDLGKGTRVVIRLPAAESEAQPTRRAGVLEVPAASAPGPSEEVEH